MSEFRITERGPTPRLLIRHVNQIHREAALELAVHWHDRYVRKHFTNAGATEYGYLPRRGERGNPDPRGFGRSYTGRKLRMKGHTRPLMWSGISYLQVIASRNNVSATAARGRARATLRMRAPALNFRNPHSRIDMRRELTAVSQREATEMEAAGQQLLDAAYRRISASETTTL